MVQTFILFPIRCTYTGGRHFRATPDVLLLCRVRWEPDYTGVYIIIKEVLYCIRCLSYYIQTMEASYTIKLCILS